MPRHFQAVDAETRKTTAPDWPRVSGEFKLRRAFLILTLKIWICARIFFERGFGIELERGEDDKLGLGHEFARFASARSGRGDEDLTFLSTARF